jgi:hypothetical protein
MVKRKPSENSKVFIKRDTIVKSAGLPSTYKGERWELVRTLSEPVIKGYVPRKYIKEI